MKKNFLWIVGGIGFSFMRLSSASAVEAPDVSVQPEPVRYAFVDGDIEKYQAHHWTKRGYVGGFQEFSLDQKLPDEISVSMEGHAIIDNNDYAANIRIERPNGGFVEFDYKEFRKYYDGTGGVYWPFTGLQVNELEKVLELDIGHFSVEIGITPEKLPDISFLYEREYKDGAKSRLTWTAVREGATTRYIGPAWQEMDERVDVFAVKASHEVKGFALNGEQRWELMRAKTTREERLLATTSVAADRKIRSQEQSPESNLMTTTFGAERWFWKEKALASAGYRFAHLSNREMENIFEMNEARLLQNFANPKQVRDARAENEYNSNTWVGHLMLIPWENFSTSTKFKAEAFTSEGNSLYPQDTTLGAPDGIINNTERSETDNRVTRWGEGISLRYTGIPRTAIYNDLELEQTRNWLSEDRNSLRGQSAPNANEIFSRETITHIWRGIWTLGLHAVPCSFADLTSQIRHRSSLNDYDDQRETNPGTNTARSAFIDGLHIHTNEFTTRLTLKPLRWIQPAFRYQFRLDDYEARAEGQTKVESDFLSNIYTFDLMLQPMERLFAAASFSRQDATVSTPANESGSTNQPAFDANVRTWLLSLDYLPSNRLTLTSTLQYSRADNFKDFTNFGLPLGADNERVELTAGFRFEVNKHLAIEPRYEFSHYKTNPHAESGNYHAHVILAEVTILWA